MPLLNLIGYSSVSYLYFLIKNLAFLIFSYSKAAKTKLANRKVLSVYKPTILKFIESLR